MHFKNPDDAHVQLNIIAVGNVGCFAYVVEEGWSNQALTVDEMDMTSEKRPH